MNAPKLRFPEFKEEWKKAKLSNISSNISYGMNAPAKIFDGYNKYIRITDIDEETNKYNCKNIVSPKGKLENKFLVKQNDILFARTGASTGKTYLYDSTDGRLYYAGFLIKASIINNNANFIFQQTKTQKYYNWVRIMSMRSGQPGINSQEYGDYVFSVTNIKEENKIANFLSLLDKRIELQSKKIEDLKLFKKGLNSFIFQNCNITYNLNDILIEYNNKTTINNEYPILSSTASGICFQENYFNKQTASKNNIGYKIIPRGYITYRSMSDTGKFYFNEQTLIEKGIVSPAYPVFMINEKIANKRYLLYYMNENQSFSNLILLEKEGGTRFALGFNKLIKLNIKLPSKIEQDKLENLINKINLKINLENNKLNKLQELKKGLMQKMFV